MTGKSIELQKGDVSLKMPPLIQKKNGERYDSVKGTTQSCKVYMVYTS